MNRHLYPTVPAELDSGILHLWHSTPRWLIYNAEHGGKRALVWAFQPATVRSARDRLTEPMPDTVLAGYLDQAEALVTAIDKLESAVKEGLLAPLAVGLSDESDILWLRTEPAKLFPAGGRLEPMAAAALGQRVARDLAIMHRSGVLHLEIQPGVIGESGGLLGLGVDIRPGPGTTTDNKLLATPGYSAPELSDASRTSPLGPATDIYAASAMLYEFVTGELPPDPRERAKDPAAARKLAASLYRELNAHDLKGEGFVRAIVAGLTPQPNERPVDAEAWGNELQLKPREKAPPPVPVAPPPPPPPKTVELALDEAWAKRAAVPVGRRRSRGLARMLVLIGVLLSLIMLAAAAAWFTGILDMTPPRVLPSPKPSATATGKTPTPRPSKPPVRRIATGTLAGQSYGDDPERFGAVLKGLWDTSSGLEAATALFMPYRESEDGLCRTPLRLHLRADGKGLLIERPAGVIWVTSWRGGKETENEVTLSVDSIWDKDGAIDAPGLTGALRRLRRNGDSIEIIYLENGQATNERETFRRCTISG